MLDTNSSLLLLADKVNLLVKLLSKNSITFETNVPRARLIMMGRRITIDPFGTFVKLQAI